MEKKAKTESKAGMQVLLSSQRDIIAKLNSLGLPGAAECYESQALNPGISGGLSFEERLQRCLEAEEEHERAMACERIVRKARFKDRLTLGDIAASPSEGLTREILQDLCGTGWIRKSVNLFITGGCGVGKTALACAIGYNLASLGISVLYFQTGDLHASLKCKSDYQARARAFKRLSSAKVLVLDDFGAGRKFDEDDEDLLLAIAEARYGAQKPLVICSQYMRNGFYDLFTGKAGAEGIMDRLVHPSYEVALKGMSRRTLKAASITDD